MIGYGLMLFQVGLRLMMVWLSYVKVDDMDLLLAIDDVVMDWLEANDVVYLLDAIDVIAFCGLVRAQS